MPKNKLFQELNLSHNPHRNGYDLGFRTRFSAKVGELLPLMHRTVMPGEKFKMSVSDFTRTAPLNAPALTNVRAYYDFFFVPYRLLWSNAPSVHTENKRNPVTADSYASNKPIGSNTPRFDVWKYRDVTTDVGYLWKLMQYKNEFGFNRGYLSGKLMNFLGYGYLSTEDLDGYLDVSHTYDPLMTEQYLSLYPLLAYQKIYYDFFRNTQWEDNQPYNYNVDYLGTNALFDVDVNENPNNFWDNPTLFDLRYANYPKDLFFGVMPEAQYGDISTVEMDSADVELSFSHETLDVTDENGNVAYVGTVGAGVGTNTQNYITGNNVSLQALSKLKVPTSDLQAVTSIQSSFNMLQLRKAQFLQKYKEIIGSGNSDYQSVVRKIFGADVSDSYSYHSIYLGGHSQDIQVSEVVNNNLVESSATIKGKGVGSGNSATIDFEAPDFGIIMCIYHCAPVVDYALNALHFDVTKTEYDDYANPVFDQLGFQELPTYYLNVKRSYEDELPIAGSHLGYTTRYFDYKFAVDQTLGYFRDTEEGKAYLGAVDFDYLSDYYVDTTTGASIVSLNSTFFKMNPKILDNVFGVECNEKVNTDQFYISATFDVQAVRPLDYFGTPY